MKVLLLTESTGSEATTSLARAFKNRNHEVTIVKPSDLHLFVSSNESGLDRVYREGKGIVNRLLAKEFDLVYPRLGGNLKFGTAILQHLQHNLGICCPIKAEALLAASDKFRTTQLCSQFGIRTPKTVLYASGGSVEQLVNKVGGVPVVIKQLSGSQGVGVSILDSMRAVRSTLDSFRKAGVNVLIQEYIDTGGKDYRVFVVGGKVVATYMRVAPKGDFRANISGGGTGIKATITKQEEFMCLLAAQAVGLPVSGVDFVRAKTGEPYLVELNGNPGFFIEKVTGISVSRPIVAFCEGEFEKFQHDRKKTGQARRDTRHLMDELMLETKKVSKILNPVLKDQYLQSILNQYKGQVLDYTDREGKPQSRKLNSMNDLVYIMSQTFQVKNQ